MRMMDNMLRDTHKIIKLKFSNFYPNFTISDLGPIFNDNKYLRNNSIEIVVDNENPDFIFYGIFGDFLFEAAKERKATKILFITEVLSPDFMLFDYCIGFEPYSFGDRYCFYPEYIYRYLPLLNKLKINHQTIDADKVLKEKTLFCDMIYSHDGIDVSRKELFDIINSYKRVESAGTYLNNQNDNIAVGYLYGDNSKYDLQKKCKFSLAVQSLNKEWFINEKIIQSFYSNQIPIFYGPKEVKNVFNSERFLFLEDFDSYDSLLKKVIEIDNNVNLYKEIISKPAFNNSFSYEKVVDDACKFIYSLFTNPKPKKMINKSIESALNNSLLRIKNTSDRYYKISKYSGLDLLRKIIYFFKRKKRCH